MKHKALIIALYFVHIVTPPLSPENTAHVKKQDIRISLFIFVPNCLPLCQGKMIKFYRKLEDFCLNLGKQRNFCICKPLQTFIRSAKLLSKISLQGLFFIPTPADFAPHRHREAQRQNYQLPQKQRGLYRSIGPELVQKSSAISPISPQVGTVAT